MALARFMEVKRADKTPSTLLRHGPVDTAEFVSRGSKAGALSREIVEIIDRSGPTNGYIHVQLALTQERGWIKQTYLHDCPEGTRNHDRLAGERHSLVRTELTKADKRWHEVQHMITSSICSDPKCACKGVDIRIKRLWFVTGQYLGETGLLTGSKETVFHGCKDAAVEPIADQGFDVSFCKDKKAFGKGLYFTPQACKAFSYAENHLLVCEIALGAPENRLTVTKRDRSLDYDSVCDKGGYRSVQAHAGAPFTHEERIVYHNTQCKPVYIVETTIKSPGGGV